MDNTADIRWIFFPMNSERAETIIKGLYGMIGGASGGALGYITGNVPGAYLGGSAGAGAGYAAYNYARNRNRGKVLGSNPRITGSILSKKKGSAPMKRKAGSQGGRSSKRTRSSFRRMRAYRRRKPTFRRKVVARKNRKYSKAVKKVIKGTVENVLQCKLARGSYTKLYSMERAVVNTTANKQLVWANGERGGANADPYSTSALFFNPFHMERLLDAASVLYNGKTKSLKYETTTNNFANEGKKLNVDFTYCSYTLTMKNTHRCAVVIELYKGTPKSDHDNDLYSDWAAGYSAQPWEQTAPDPTTYGQTMTNNPQVKDSWKIKHQRIYLAPGASKTIYTTWKGCIDFDRFKSGGVLVQHGKGISQNWVFVVKPVLGMEQATNPTGTAGQTNGATTFEGVVFLCKEVYKCLQPDLCAESSEGNKMINLVDIPRTNVNNNINSVIKNEKEVTLAYV